MPSESIVALPPTSFTAPWPEQMEPTYLEIVAQKIWDIVSVILFPIGLARLVYYGLQDLAGRLIHPAAFDNPSDLERDRKCLKQIGGEEITIGTPDGEKINAMLFRGSGRNKGAIVSAFGNNGYYERSGAAFLSLVRTFVGRDIDVLMINPRGCGKSTGKSSPVGLALDAYSACEYLVQKEKIAPGRVFSYGHSLGGYYGVSGAALLQKQHPKARISALSDRSFSSLTEAAYEILGNLASSLIWLLGREHDAKKSWEQLKGHKIVVYDKQDNCIPYPASFHNYVRKTKHVKDVWEIEMHSPPGAGEDIHCRYFTEDEATEIGQRIRAAIDLPSHARAEAETA